MHGAWAPWKLKGKSFPSDKEETRETIQIKHHRRGTFTSFMCQHDLMEVVVDALVDVISLAPALLRV